MNSLSQQPSPPKGINEWSNSCVHSSSHSCSGTTSPPSTSNVNNQTSRYNNQNLSTQYCHSSSPIGGREETSSSNTTNMTISFQAMEGSCSSCTTAVVSTPTSSALESHNVGSDSIHVIEELTKLLKLEKERNRLLMLEQQIWKQKEQQLSQILHNDLETLKNISEASIGNSTPFSTTSGRSCFKHDFKVSSRSGDQTGSSKATINNSTTTSTTTTTSANKSNNHSLLPMTSSSTSTAPSPGTTSSLSSTIGTQQSLHTPLPPPKPIRLVTKMKQALASNHLGEDQLLEHVREFVSLEKEFALVLKCLNRYFLPLIHECFRKREISCFPNLLALDHLLVIMKLNAQIYQEFDNFLNHPHQQQENKSLNLQQMNETPTTCHSSSNNPSNSLYEQFLSVLSNHVHKLRIFKNYAEHLPSLLQILKKELKSNEEFQEYVRRSEKHLYSLKGSLWRVDAFFKFPLEYIERAVQILQNLKQAAEKSSSLDMEILSMVIEKFSKIQEYIRSSTHPKIDLSQMTEIAESLEMIGLVTAKRYLIKSCLAEKMRESGAVTPCRLFLFNDMLIIKYTRKYRWLW
ncbi:hypothetical protein FDP41_009456 [Naegleria fowleri]|uniref:DH domain-containing protein n=2 Tax=Naegleria fowleri TaxID=5763 RepID=A0A6A5BBA9_NAEFO|nr:uncharacterized protein FDP41_009456 [Naegleria fowleri]KAF0972252.1 hypothetical protein FDP41_009456 [Naegleria fowleri]